MTVSNLLPIEDEPRFAKDARGFATRAVQAGAPHDPVTGAVIEPVKNPSPFSFQGFMRSPLLPFYLFFMLTVLFLFLLF